jgi:hypothetical protein
MQAIKRKIHYFIAMSCSIIIVNWKEIDASHKIIHDSNQGLDELNMQYAWE